MEKKLANIISIIFYPLLMPSFGILIIFLAGTYMNYIPVEIQRSIFLVVFIATFLLPMSVFPFFVFNKTIKNIFLNSRRERFIPLFIGCIFYYIAYYLLSRIAVPSIIRSFMLAATISIFIALFINVKFKISLHMIGIGGLTGLIIAMFCRMLIFNLYLFAIAIFISGLVAYARLFLKKHNQAEVYSGYFLGLATVFLVTYFF
jgi:hypothetical protein